MLGLIFGDTDFPKIILNKVKKKNKRYIIIDLSLKNNFKKDKNSFKVSLGEFGKIINILKKNDCKNVLFAGKVNKPKFSKLKLDFKGLYYMPKIVKSSQIGDAAILREVINIFKKEKIKTISSLSFNKELTLKKGNYTKTLPNSEDKKDIKIATKILNKLNSFNFSQGIVVKNKKVLAVEGKGGTQKMLAKCKKRASNFSGVLVKFPKKKQDLRIDLPTVGIKTFLQCKSAKLKGVVLKSSKNIFLDKKKCINYANKNRMFIKVI
tara:strand:- start:14 stop:808 length:795 start_codon:yes stop_codon:yes gene_type:complete